MFSMSGQKLSIYKCFNASFLLVVLNKAEISINGNPDLWNSMTIDGILI
jgi:hypothetical protein